MEQWNNGTMEVFGPWKYLRQGPWKYLRQGLGSIWALVQDLEVFKASIWAFHTTMEQWSLDLRTAENKVRSGQVRSGRVGKYGSSDQPLPLNSDHLSY